MTAPHDTRRWRVFVCPACGLLSSDRVLCEGDGLTVEHPAREAEPVEVAPVQSEGERFPLYVLDADGNVAPVLAVTDAMEAAAAIAWCRVVDGPDTVPDMQDTHAARLALESALAAHHTGGKG